MPAGKFNTSRRLSRIWKRAHDAARKCGKSAKECGARFAALAGQAAVKNAKGRQAMTRKEAIRKMWAHFRYRIDDDCFSEIDSILEVDYEHASTADLSRLRTAHRVVLDYITEKAGGEWQDGTDDMDMPAEWPTGSSVDFAAERREAA